MRLQGQKELEAHNLRELRRLREQEQLLARRQTSAPSSSPRDRASRAEVRGCPVGHRAACHNLIAELPNGGAPAFGSYW